jgi:hypothetical protein
MRRGASRKRALSAANACGCVCISLTSMTTFPLAPAAPTQEHMARRHPTDFTGHPQSTAVVWLTQDGSVAVAGTRREPCRELSVELPVHLHHGLILGAGQSQPPMVLPCASWLRALPDEAATPNPTRRCGARGCAEHHWQPQLCSGKSTMTAGVDGPVVRDERAWPPTFSLTLYSIMLSHLVVTPTTCLAMLNGAAVQLERLQDRMWSSRQALAAGVAYGLATTLNHR